MTIQPQDSYEIQDLSSLHHYRTEIPNIIFHKKLDIWQFGIYCFLKKTAGDNGSCFKSNLTLCKEIGCSVPTLVRVKNELQALGLIVITKRTLKNGGLMPDLIQIVDIWLENMQEMSKLYPKNESNAQLNKSTNLAKIQKWDSKPNLVGVSNPSKPDLVPLLKTVKYPTKRRLHKEEHKQEEQIQEEQQQAAVFFQTNNEVYQCMINIQILHKDKIEITQRYEESIVKNAINWAFHAKTKITTTLVQALKWACKNQPQIPEEKEKQSQEQYNKNKSYAYKYDLHSERGVTITTLNSLVEISFLGAGRLPICLKYCLNNFIEKFNEILKSFGIARKTVLS